MLHAVDDIDMQIQKGSTLGVVGESGCGKSTLGRVVLGLINATGGEIYYKGKDTVKYSSREQKSLRKEMQIIFQDPYASLNPRMSVSEIIAEPIRVNHILHGKKEIDQRVKELMETVGIARRLAYAYPHELDGGRRQRVGIARALAAGPELLLMDEPFGAVDEITRGQLQDELLRIHRESGITVLFVTHDIAEALKLGTRTLVMDAGQIQQYDAPSRLLAHPATSFVERLVRRSRVFQTRA